MGDIKKIVIKSLQGQSEYGLEDTEAREDVQQIVEGAPEALDTFKEIAEYINQHGEVASEIIKSVKDNADAIANETIRAKAAEQEIYDYLSEEEEARTTEDNNIKDKAMYIEDIVPQADDVDLYIRTLSMSTNVQPEVYSIPSATTEKAGVMTANLYKRILELERKVEELINNGGGSEDVENAIKVFIDGFNATIEGKGVAVNGENLVLNGDNLKIDGDNLIIT